MENQSCVKFVFCKKKSRMLSYFTVIWLLSSVKFIIRYYFIISITEAKGYGKIFSDNFKAFKWKERC